MRLTQVSGGTAAFLGLLFAAAALAYYMTAVKCDDCWRPAEATYRTLNYRGEPAKVHRLCPKHDTIKGHEEDYHMDSITR